MTAKLTIHQAPIEAIRARAQAYPQALAGAMVTHAQKGFGAQSPSPIGTPPARKSGALARSIVAVRVNAYRWQVIAGASYAPFLEFGTKRMSARPFFMRAFDAVAKNPPKLG
ncbi:MAG: hypothetical protein SFZ02_07455 [bacterium]|nr:hypothetical protein [bacterium]